MMIFLRTFLPVLLLLALPFSTAVLAEEEPIYLEEPELPPAPKVAARQDLKEEYKDGSPRVERVVAKMSDNSFQNDGKYVEYHRGGEVWIEGSFKKGIPHGTWSYFYPNGQLRKKVVFDTGRPEGEWEVFREDGTLQAKKTYKKGKRHGKWFVYFKDGKKVNLEAEYANSKPHGTRILYFENGNMSEKTEYKQGKREGLATTWNESGKKTAEATYSEGKLVGSIQRFD